ncbi:hypothetical protein SESBI_08058 [Sesbania bispinosa]|nr:hypothetical protein SESBI_08058 [Sesbania bispinosa]
MEEECTATAVAALPEAENKSNDALCRRLGLKTRGARTTTCGRATVPEKERV